MTKTLGTIIGIIFLLVGLLGFIGGLGIVGPTGTFMTNHAHDAVHLITGLLFIIWAMAAPRSVGTGLKLFGVIYLLVALLGFISSTGSVLGFISINSADNWLHVVLGIVVLLAGFAGSKNKTMAQPMA
jgi:Domain of unknown function (DUF4383)